ncbi:MAG: SGNH/GDSL hydrolase family protein [Coleofasciculaceae cyanobacterium SM2_1_6]|nr:SGNH/GDSL hydrolase family protein [Coleofasciculaceae cyanobacterium SM2_1_6]
MTSIVFVVIGILILLLAMLEMGLRAAIGFGNPLIYVADPEVGYLLAPNQRVRRFGNWVEINEYSMRSSSLSNSPPDLRILLLGDSVLNGSWWTDQNETISAVVTKILLDTYSLANSSVKATLPSNLLNDSPSNFLDNSQSNSSSNSLTNSPLVEVLNISANGWSPRNELAYLQKFGCFQAQILVLLLNTDDLFGTAPTSIPVGNDRYYPSQKPALAILEAATRLLPYAPPPEMAVVNAEGGDRVGFNLAAIQEIHHITQTQNIALKIALTPLLPEVIDQPKDYEIVARSRLATFTQEQGIAYLDFLPIFQSHAAPKTLFRDQIHLSPAGNQLVGAEISKLIVAKTHHLKLENEV